MLFRSLTHETSYRAQIRLLIRVEVQKIFGDFRPDYPACRNRIIRPVGTGLSGLSKPDYPAVSDFSKVAFNCCIKFALIFVFVSIQLCHIVIKKKKKREKKSAKEIQKKRKSAISLWFIL